MSRFRTDSRTLQQSSFKTIEAYWADPAPFEAERAREQAKIDAAWDAKRRLTHPYLGGDDDAA